MIGNIRNQKEIPTLKTETGKTKLTIRYLYLENISEQNRTEQNILLLTLRLYNTTYEIIYTDHGQKDNNIIKDTCTVSRVSSYFPIVTRT